MLKSVGTAVLAAACIPLFGQNFNAKVEAPPPAPQTIRVTILGSGGGPAVNLRRYGPSILIEAGGQKLLFDCGRGVSFRLTELGIPLREVDKIFLTHLHSDHILSIPDLLLTGWGVNGRTTPLEVWGPAGTRSMMDNMLKTFAFDIHIRRDVDEKFPADGIKVVSTDIKEGLVYDRGGVKVTAYLVDHGPVKPAFGYRVDYGGHSVGMSGDTRFSENLIKHDQGVDLLIHEVGGRGARANFIKQGLTPAQAEAIVSHHSSPEDTAKVFNLVKPKLAVYAHGGNPQIAAEVRKLYSGRVEVGQDLMTIDIGDQVEVHRPDR
jgi:ribonuclease Z